MVAMHGGVKSVITIMFRNKYEYNWNIIGYDEINGFTFLSFEMLFCTHGSKTQAQKPVGAVS